jgi:hypothetical protein
MNEDMRIQVQEREKNNSPFNFFWAEDPFVDAKVIEPVPFLLGNDGPLGNYGGELRADIQDPSEAGSLTGRSEGTDLNSSINGAANGSSAKHSSNTDRKRTNSDRKRSLSTAEIGQSDSGTVSRRKKKPKGMPKRPLSAYNLYFQSERAKILKAAENGGVKIGFEGLGKIIGKKWREVDAVGRKVYDKLAEKDSVRYRKEMEAYYEMKSKKVDDDEKRISNTSYNESSSSSSSGIDQVDLAAQARRPYESSTALNPEDSFAGCRVGQIRSSSSQREDFSRPPMTMPAQPPAQGGLPAYSEFATPEASQAPYQVPYNLDVGMQRNHLPLSNQPGCQYISLPPPPVGAEQVSPPSSCSIPPGMEIHLNGRKYRVEYSCYSMTRDAAHKYIESLTGAPSTGRTAAPA